MSVLFLRRVQHYELWNPCANGCVQHGGSGQRKHGKPAHLGRATAHWEAELMGRHAAWLCDGCKESWQGWWPAAGGSKPGVDGRRGGSFGHREAA